MQIEITDKRAASRAEHVPALAIEQAERLRETFERIDQVSAETVKRVTPNWLRATQTLIAGAVIIIVAAIIFPSTHRASASDPAPLDQYGRALMRQSAFPCAEDEYLGFASVDAFEGLINAPALSRDYVICQSVDLVNHNAVMGALKYCADQGLTLKAGATLDRNNQAIGAPVCAAPGTSQSTPARLIEQTGITGQGRK